jgi:hypothetical protein
MTTVTFEIDDALSYEQNIKAFTDALKQLDSDLAPALATELESVPDEPTQGRDATLGNLFSAMKEKSS